MEATKKTPDFDKIVKLSLLGMIAICMIALVIAVLSSGKSSGMPAGAPPGMSGSSGAPSGAPSDSANASSAGAQAQGGAASSGMATGSSRASSGGGAAITVEAAALSPATIRTSIRLNGDVSSKSQISIYPDTSGKLVRYEVSVGSQVKKGDVIAYVDPSKPGASYVSSPVRSSIDGTVISLSHDVGETISTSSAVATVGALNALEIVTYVPEKYIAVVHTGLLANVSLAPYPDKTFAATVSQVSPVVDSTSRTIQIKLAVSDGSGELRPGMFAVITLVTKEASGAMVVPSSALKSYNNKDIVYVIDSDGIARRKEVSVGLTNDTSVQLLSGVSFGDRVVVSGSVTDGTTVRIASTGAAE